jgi:hypothetical protein
MHFLKSLLFYVPAFHYSTLLSLRQQVLSIIIKQNKAITTQDKMMDEILETEQSQSLDAGPVTLIIFCACVIFAQTITNGNWNEVFVVNLIMFAAQHYFYRQTV